MKFPNFLYYPALVGAFTLIGGCCWDDPPQSHKDAGAKPAQSPSMPSAGETTPRSISVTGAITSPGGRKILAYTSRVTVLGAISAAGGFNGFAARHRVKLTRADGKVYIVDCKKALRDPKLDLEVLPGDQVFVDEQELETGFIVK